MSSSNQPGDLFLEGRLTEAVEAARQAVQRKPTDAGLRVLLAELLLFMSDFERADAVIAALESIEPDTAIVVAEFRQLLRAAVARRQLGSDGRLPEFLGEPTAFQKRILQAFVALRAGDAGAAADAAEAAEAIRPVVTGTANGTSFDDFRDADDLNSGSLEVLTTTGKYFWLPMERVISLEFHVPKRPRDLFWRRCTISVKEGPDGDIYLPALYETDGTDDQLRLGRSTMFSSAAPVRGSGQRMFVVGDDALSINELQTVQFA